MKIINYVIVYIHYSTPWHRVLKKTKTGTGDTENTKVDSLGGVGKKDSGTWGREQQCWGRGYGEDKW